MDVDKALSDLEIGITRLKRDYDRFFAGAEKLSPERERDRIAAEIRRLNTITMQNQGQRFLFQTLMARFYTYCELWNRLVRAKEEEGAAAAALAAAHRAATPPRPAAELRADGCVVSSAGGSPGLSGLYQKFLNMQAEAGEVGQKVSEKGFRQLVLGQYQQLCNRFGTDSIEFRVAVKDGKIQLKAKPVATKQAR